MTMAQRRAFQADPLSIKPDQQPTFAAFRAGVLLKSGKTPIAGGAKLP